MCNCSNGCIHRKCKKQYKMIGGTKTLANFLTYCDKHEDRHQEFCRENNPNVVMDCYQPNETTQLLDEMNSLLSEFNKGFQK